MSKPEGHLPADSELQAPKGLADDLSALFGPGTDVPPQTDQAILAMARRQLSRRAEPRRLFRWAAAAVVAAAAAVIIVVQLAFPPERPAVKCTNCVHNIGAAVKRYTDSHPELAQARPAAKAVPSLAPRPSPLVPRPPLEGDINGDGRVDILDAFALAKQIELANALKPEWDFNHDGVVDRKDAEAIARAAVKLSDWTQPPAKGG